MVIFAYICPITGRSACIFSRYIIPGQLQVYVHYLKWPIKTIALCATPWTGPKAVVHCSTAVPTLVALDLNQVLPVISYKSSFSAHALFLPEDFCYTR